ncbi:putative ORFan [Tupanvirus deep ocean]|uniref:ORFan n=2 Tax=Tupanvirus TaxID=2094720 RepID=A0AC62A7J6_9VIRU|nr:putative ORFan [Tupanvirus deep ocean]QKU33627.1 putative ORFan [Tupanvirus deep ocean]
MHHQIPNVIQDLITNRDYLLVKKFKSYYSLEIMSANLHVVLFYDLITSTLIAELRNANNVPNYLLPEPFDISATYRFIRNEQLYQEIVNGDRVELEIPRPSCSDEYRVYALYTANSIVQPLSVDTIVIGQDFIYGTFIDEQIIPGGVILNLVPPVGVTPTNIVWVYNYEILDPQPADPFNVVAQGNGIYEVAFQSNETGLSYYTAIEVIESTPSMYVKILGNDGLLYGTFGVPQNVTSLIIFPVGGQQPYRYKTFVNGVQISDNRFINLINHSEGDLIYFYVTDCCDITLIANTFVLSCGTLPDFTPTVPLGIQSRKNNIVVQHSKHNTVINLKPYPRPNKQRPIQIAKPPKPRNV